MTRSSAASQAPSVVSRIAPLALPVSTQPDRNGARPSSWRWPSAPILSLVAPWWMTNAGVPSCSTTMPWKVLGCAGLVRSSGIRSSSVVRPKRRPVQANEVIRPKTEFSLARPAWTE